MESQSSPKHRCAPEWHALQVRVTQRPPIPAQRGLRQEDLPPARHPARARRYRPGRRCQHRILCHAGGRGEYLSNAYLNTTAHLLIFPMLLLNFRSRVALSVSGTRSTPRSYNGAWAARPVRSTHELRHLKDSQGGKLFTPSPPPSLQVCGAGGLVVSVEPIPATCDALRHNVASHSEWRRSLGEQSPAPVTVINAGAGDGKETRAEFTFYRRWGQKGKGSWAWNQMLAPPAARLGIRCP